MARNANANDPGEPNDKPEMYRTLTNVAHDTPGAPPTNTVAPRLDLVLHDHRTVSASALDADITEYATATTIRVHVKLDAELEIGPLDQDTPADASVIQSRHGIITATVADEDLVDPVTLGLDDPDHDNHRIPLYDIVTDIHRLGHSTKNTGEP